MSSDELEPEFIVRFKVATESQPKEFKFKSSSTFGVNFPFHCMNTAKTSSDDMELALIVRFKLLWNHSLQSLMQRKYSFRFLYILLHSIKAITVCLYIC